MPRGTYKRTFPKMIGLRFNRWLVLQRDFQLSKLHRASWYLCRCDCGIEKSVNANHLRNGGSRSCGCFSREIHRKLLSQTGENNPGYLHGLDGARHQFVKVINARDKVCQYDDDNEHNGRLEAHHLDGDIYNNDEVNGSLLCDHHHKIVTRSGNQWRPNHVDCRLVNAR